ncbi:MAG TPA: hypothetical protein VNY53_01335 [Bradyrhizobium sp.]|nr:hypothetical protein [Bradyrhizobium sp.]
MCGAVSAASAVGTQGAVAFISTLIQGWGPPASIFPGIDRFAGITGGLLVLLAVSWLTAPSTISAPGLTAAEPERYG